MQKYDFNIVHRPGRIQSNAYCLTRRPYDSCEISSLKKEEPQTSQTQEMQRRDPELSAMIDFLLTIKMHARFYSQAIIFSGAPARAQRARSGAPWVRKFGKLSIPENLVMT